MSNDFMSNDSKSNDSKSNSDRPSRQSPSDESRGENKKPFVEPRLRRETDLIDGTGGGASWED